MAHKKILFFMGLYGTIFATIEKKKMWVIWPAEFD
jgi:hypothetical protein